MSWKFLSDLPFLSRGARLLLVIVFGTLSACGGGDGSPSEPTLTGATPALVCNVQLTTSISLVGTEFLSDDTIPDVSVRRLRDLQGTSVSDESIALPSADSRVVWVSAEAMTIEAYPALGLAPGVYEIAVENTDGGRTVLPDALTVVPKPTLTAVEPTLGCVTDAAATVTLRGEAFIRIDSVAPTVMIGGQAASVQSLGGCTALANVSGAEICTSAVVTVAQGTLNAGDQAVSITNPSPVGCHDEESRTFYVAAAPTVTAITPDAICEIAQPSEVTVTGQGFLRLDDGTGTNTLIDPVVTVDGNAVTPTWTSASCATVANATVTGELCTEFSFPVPNAGFANGSYEVVVTNPTPAACAGSGSFSVVGAPVVTDVVSFALCADGDTFTVTGTGFVDGSEILFDGSPVSTTFVSSTQLTGTIASASTPGLYDVSVRNLASCGSNVLASAVQVVAPLDVYAIDPAHVYSAVATPLSLWSSNIYGNSPSVAVRPAGSSDSWTTLSSPAFDGSRRVDAVVPTGLSSGDYDLRLQDDPCEAEISSAINVVETLSVHVSNVAPAYGVQGERTRVSIESADPTPNGLVNFAPTPRAYLMPVAGGAMTELEGVSYISANRFDAIVPSDLAPGEYRVVVVLSDGQVGQLSSPTYRVVPSSDPPPTITSLGTEWLDAAANQSLTLLGRNFPLDVGDVEVSASCRDPRGVGVDMNLSGTIDTTTATAVSTTWDLTNLTGYVCVVQLTNVANSTFADFSAFSVVNASSNLANFAPTPDMVEARRALGAAAVRADATSRFLFAIGGDGGDDSVNPVVRHATVEASLLDAHGALSGGFTQQRNQLPDARAFASAAVVDRYVYLAGGRVGPDPGVVDDGVLRAYLLDPDDAPALRDVDIERSVNGLAVGTWHYRVAAVMGSWNAGNPSAPENRNPGGLELASAPLVVRMSSSGLRATLSWAGVAGADRYVIYRSATPNASSGSEVFLAEIAHQGAAGDIQTFVDDGVIDNSEETASPMPYGSLGVWHEVATLNTEREGAAIVAVPEPSDPNLHYLYVIGGRDSDGDLVSLNEKMNVRSTESVQTVTPAMTTGGQLPNGRWQHGAVYVDASRGPVGANVFIYVLSGFGPFGWIDTDISALPVDIVDGVGNDDGSLLGAATVAVSGPSHAGYCSVAGNDFLHIAGGQSATPSVGGRKIEVVGSPTLTNWSNAANLGTSRYLLGSATEGPFVYVLGGQTAAEFASRSTERTSF